MTKDETPILPQAAAFLVISYLVYRFFFTTPASGSDGSSPVAAPRRPVDRRRLQQQVEVVRGMFPQFSVAAVEAELIRNGGNIETTTERILTTGFLPEPPQPAPRAVPVQPGTSTSGASSSSTRTNRPVSTLPETAGSASTPRMSQYTDLITRYNLHSRLGEEPSATTATSSTTLKGKTPVNRQDRQLTHKARRDEMILTARRTVETMIEKERLDAVSRVMS